MDTEYVTTTDGVRIAYAMHGAGPPLVFSRGWFSHIGLMWDDPPFRVFFEAIAQLFTVVRFDMRGCGLSARDVGTIDLEGMVRDLEAVVDALDLQSFVLYGQCFGGPAAIAYAARCPERVSKLILDGTYAEGARVARPERQRQIIATLRDMPEAGLAFLTHLTHPNPGPSVFRVHQSNAPSVNIETAVELYTLGFTFDVKDLLPKITAPTLVMHRESTRAIPFRLGRELAASIRGARFVPLEGQAHNSWEEYPDAAIAAIGEFLGVPLALASVEEPPERFLAVMVVELEPAAGASVEDEVRRAIAAHNGTEITQNDGGVKALFAAAADAVECAIDVERMLAAQAPERAVRIGVHAGEQVARGGAPADTVVAVARQAAAACATSEIMVSAAIRERCAGHGFLFAERDASAALEGERLAWYEVQWRQDA